jgi:hypothetical protein
MRRAVGPGLGCGSQRLSTMGRSCTTGGDGKGPKMAQIAHRPSESLWQQCLQDLPWGDFEWLS